ncbi:MAG: peptide/nickel transport system substrate-binding protein [Gammaproteobacteria bacterium]|jgi:peptide/nickel transport system substrate-binding protein
MTRREAITYLTAVGVTAANAGVLFTEAGTVAAMTPKKGGTLRFANNIHGPDDQMDPVLFTSGIDYARGRTTYNSLVQHDENLTPQPELAESFESNQNATEWTFKIRKGVKFHDGSALTADDVVWSMNRHLGEKSVSVIKSVVASVQEWKKTGSHEVKAIMNTPNADLPTLLGVFQSKIVKKDTTNFQLGNGTGPFRMESFEPGVKSLHVRNEDYWRKPANFDAIEITAITNPVARVNALVAGDMDMISQVDPKAIRQIEAASGVRVSSVPAGLYIGICALKNSVPGNNDDFVKGMQYIQDRERVVKRILKGHGTVGNDQPIMSAYGDDFCSELPQRQYDPDKAKFHFKKAGMSSANLHVAPVASGIEDMCLLTQANCAKIGFDLNVKRVPSDGYWGAVWMKEPVNVVTWNMRPTANAMLSIQFAPGAAWNDTFWNNERFGKLLSQSLAETDPVKRHDMYCEMQH